MPNPTAYERDRVRIENAALRSARSVLIVSGRNITDAILRNDTTAMRSAVDGMAVGLRPSLTQSSLASLLRGRMRSLVVARANGVPVVTRSGGSGRHPTRMVFAASGTLGKPRPKTIGQLAQEAIGSQLWRSSSEERGVAAAAADRVRLTTETLSNHTLRVVLSISAELTDDPLPASQAVAYIRSRLGSAGLSLARPYVIETIYRTAVQTAYSAGRMQANADPAIQEILWGYQYSAVMDDRTSDLCSRLDQLVRPKDDPVWQTLTPPNHYNCRSDLLEVFHGDSLAIQTDIPDVEVDPAFRQSWAQLLAA